MIDSGDYMLAWQVYMGCGVAALLLWGLLLRVYRFGAFRFWLFLSVAFLVLTPWHHPDVQGVWVPALLGGLLTIMTDGVEAALPALIILGGGQIGALLISIAAAVMTRSKPADEGAKEEREADNAPPATDEARKPAISSGRGKAGQRIEPKF